MPVLKIMTWNILFSEKIANIIKQVKEIEPDILLCQELTQNCDDNDGIDTAAALSEALGYHYFAAEKNYAGGDEENFLIGNGIFSHFPISDTRSVLVHEGLNPGTGNKDEARLYIEGQVDIAGQKLVVGCTHLSFTPWFKMNPAKKLEADKLVDEIKKHKDRYLIGGDFNAEPGSYPINQVEKYLKSAGPDDNQKTFTTIPFSYKGMDANSLDWRIDYLFTTPDVKVKSSRIVKTDYSDHLPILAEIEI